MVFTLEFSLKKNLFNIWPHACGPLTELAHSFPSNVLSARVGLMHGLATRERNGSICPTTAHWGGEVFFDLYIAVGAWPLLVVSLCHLKQSLPLAEKVTPKDPSFEVSINSLH